VKRISGNRPTVMSRRAVPGRNSAEASSGRVSVAVSMAPDWTDVRAGRGERTGMLAVSREDSPSPVTDTVHAAIPSALPAVKGKIAVPMAPLAMVNGCSGLSTVTGPEAVSLTVKVPSLPVSLRTATVALIASSKARKRGKLGNRTSGLFTSVVASAEANRRPDIPAAMSRSCPWNAGISKETCAFPEGPTSTGPDQKATVRAAGLWVRTKCDKSSSPSPPPARALPISGGTSGRSMENVSLVSTWSWRLA